MALIVEDGTGKVNSEAYVSSSEADTYHSNRGNAAWAAVPDQLTKEQYLRKAADYMQQAYRLRWTGNRTTVAQALDWPRAWVPVMDQPSPYASSPNYLDPNTIPAEVKNACSELALAAVSGALAPALTRLKSSVKVGEIAVTYDPDAPEYTRFRNVDMLLSPYLRGSAAMSPLVRS